jgi:predicted nucleotidyltransferase component of viral defense system
MNLHHDMKLLSDTLRAASQYLNIKLEFVEKDYWITLVLCRLSKSSFASDAVFKGGTSLSKAYHLIERFSEDVDLAIINDNAKNGTEIKKIIRTIEKEITSDLKELYIDGLTSKGSRFRKSAYEFITTEKDNKNNKLIVEINSFANPFPYQKQMIRSMVFDFLKQNAHENYIEEYNLQPFEVNVLSREQTVLEKMLSLVRFSFYKNTIESVSGKIRHFYDLFYLMKNQECAEFAASVSFKEKFDALLKHDKVLFDEPEGWQTKVISESPLAVDFSNIWNQLKEQYRSELSSLAYRPIPDEKEVAKCFEQLIKRIL